MAAGGEALFEAAVSAVLRGWPALKMAVSNQFGGPQSQAKATWMEGATAQWMRENADIQPNELEAFLETLLDQEFDTIIEDESTPEVSRKICDLYRNCCHGNEDILRTFLASQHLPLSPDPPPHTVESGECVRMEEVGGGEGVEQRDSEPDAEGWTVVKKSQRRSRH